MPDKRQKALVGELEPTDGEVWVKPSIRIGYLAQDQETLDPGSTPLDTARLAHRCGEGETVSLLMNETANRSTSTRSRRSRRRSRSSTGPLRDLARPLLLDRIVEVRASEVLSYEGSWSDWHERVSATDEAATPRV